MKTRLIISLVVAMAAGLASFFVARSLQQSRHGGILLDQLPELAWLHQELHLTDTQFAAVRKLHVEYRPKCEVMCQRITDAQSKAQALAAANRQMTPELSAAIRRYGEVQADCRHAMLEHLYQTAALLDPDQSKRYLEAMLPHALGAPQHAPSCHESE